MRLFFKYNICYPFFNLTIVANGSDPQMSQQSFFQNLFMSWQWIHVAISSSEVACQAAWIQLYCPLELADEVQVSSRTSFHQTKWNMYNRWQIGKLAGHGRHYIGYGSKTGWIYSTWQYLTGINVRTALKGFDLFLINFSDIPITGESISNMLNNIQYITLGIQTVRWWTNHR